MKQAAWLLVIASIGALGYWFWTWKRRWTERERAAEQRLAALVAQAKPAAAMPPATPPPSPNPGLLFDAAAKTAAAGEPALSIQLYARLIARYPDSQFATQARAAVDIEKKKLAKA